MMSALTYVAPVFLVSDLDRSLSYYQRLLGFEIDFDYEGFYASVVRDGCRLHLKKAAPCGRDQQAIEEAEHIDACFIVSDAADLASQFTDAGATLSVPLRQAPYGMEFYVKDPDGYILGFVQSAD
jgi:catechol 2,3-dioxygenase-like lactoylglutathione lyase family enzyme